MASCLALSVVIPVYNGARSIGPLVEALDSLDVPGGLEIVLVYDGSPDDSLAVCRGLIAHTKAPVTVVEHARNYGEHNAILTGLRHARGSHVITMDDDLQNPPSEVVKLWRHARDTGRQVVYTYYERKEHAWWRNLGSRFTNWCADRLLDKPRGLYLSSFRCMTAFVAQQILRYEGPYPYVDGLILQVTQDIDRLAVLHLPRAEGRSSYTFRRLVRLWLNMFVNFSVMPLRLATLLGFAVSIIGLIVAVVIVAEALFGDPPPGWASIMAAFLLISGVQLLMLGMIGEYLGRVTLSVNQKPQATVKEVYRPEASEAGDAVHDLRRPATRP
ncbi:MAG: glycosyltransferase [Alphaproteobacteria bacterium]|nr:glycosyltransferase [Alphaproteobacteria bacterium]